MRMADRVFNLEGGFPSSDNEGAMRQSHRAATF
jgi:hypothetical protein